MREYGKGEGRGGNNKTNTGTTKQTNALTFGHTSCDATQHSTSQRNATQPAMSRWSICHCAHDIAKAQIEQRRGVCPEVLLFFDEFRKVLYLDLNTTTYCNVFGGNPCTPPLSADPNFTWASRESLSALEDDLRDSDYRLGDLYMVLDPDLTNEDLTSEEFNDRTKSAAVVDNRDSIVEAAQYTILTTISVIAIILGGIFLLTKDMSFLSKYLLRPLRELADDMESIAQLHMGAVSVDKDSFGFWCMFAVVRLWFLVVSCRCWFGRRF